MNFTTVRLKHQQPHHRHNDNRSRASTCAAAVEYLKSLFSTRTVITIVMITTYVNFRSQLGEWTHPRRTPASMRSRFLEKGSLFCSYQLFNESDTECQAMVRIHISSANHRRESIEKTPISSIDSVSPEMHRRFVSLRKRSLRWVSNSGCVNLISLC